jgi:hypothetical protein
LCAIVFVVLIRFCLLPALADTAQQGQPGPYAQTWANVISYVTDSGLEAAFATVILAVLFLALVPEEVRLGKIETLSPKDIRRALLEEVSTGDEYYFRGRSARWFRSNVLPQVAASARSESKTKRIYLLLPDPDNHILMQDYADYRNSISFRGKSTPWTAWDIEREVLATLASVAYENSQNILVTPEVGMLNSYALMRVDMINDRAVLTREDPQQPAIRCFKGSTLFDSTKEEILQGISQGRQLTLPSPGPAGQPLDDVFVRALLMANGFISVASNATQVSEIVDTCINPKDPYK